MAKVYISPSNQRGNAYSYGGTNEMEQCYKIGQAVQVALTRCGIQCKLAAKGQAMSTSISQSNAYKPDVHLCIHTNAGGGKGTDVFVYQTVTANLKYARPVYNELVKLTGKGRSLAANAGLAEVNQTSGICVYCECEFHDNATLAKWIVNNTTKIGEAIAKGLCSSFGITYKAATTTTAADVATCKITMQYLAKNLKTNKAGQVLTLQRILRSLRDGAGYNGKDGKPLKLDGSFGENTEFALKSFQTVHKMTVSGVMKRVDWAKLLCEYTK